LMIAPVLGFFLTKLAAINDKLYPEKLELPPAAVVTFEASTPPAISIKNYLHRIVKYTPCSAECYLLSLILIDRVVQSRGFRVSSGNIHRILITSIMISTKLLDDVIYNNKYYSHVGGIEVKELNSLESKFLNMLNYNLSISTELFECYRCEVETQVIRSCDDRDPLASALSLESVPEESEQSPVSSPPAGTAPVVVSDKSRENARLLAKKLRRTRSLNINNQPSSPSDSSNTNNNGRLFGWRKRRSTSFNISEVV